ncbi:VPLPA-CTERM sorting domain-containing protein [Roseospira marina]|nr:VPLPA-CTERM sorting domain-containing protein [Roseospira marina]MBB4315088.1 hypothetical protein [Roseospira marina]MBB5088142.1 hypothetical protein [Roseospira marina]
MKGSILALAAGAFALSAASANAAIVDLDFGSSMFGVGYGQTSKTYALGDGVELTVSAGNTSTGLFAPESYLGQNGFGFTNTTGWVDDPHVDGFGPNEFIDFTFNKIVDFVSVGFSLFNNWPEWDDDAALYVDGTEVGGSPTDDNPFFFASETSGTTLRVAALGWNDDFKIKSLSYDIPAEVPLPAAAWFMLTALGGLAGGRWLRKGDARAAA